MVSKTTSEMRPPSPPLPPDPSEMQRSRSTHSRGISVSSHSSPNSQRSQAPSDTRRSGGQLRPSILSQPQQVEAAVNTAFDESRRSSGGLDPEFIKQVTEQVIQNLQKINLAGVATNTAVPAKAPQDTSPHIVQSPIMSSPEHAPTRYTPSSSPDHHRGERSDFEYLSSSPDAEAGSERVDRMKEDLSNSGNSKSADAFSSDRSDLSGQVRRNTAANRGTGGGPNEAQTRRAESAATSTAREEKPMPQHQDGEETSGGTKSDEDVSQSRPETGYEETTLERIWQPLFADGKPTIRSSQVLRGLAIQLIDDYEPKGSHVVTPATMLRFFNETKVDDEQYPWQTIFGGKMSNASISQMYRRLLCQHHLVQARLQEAPTIPALTQQGFDAFITCLIQAHPDKEHERLAKAVMNMPISNADDRSERFPKELPRRLFPEKGNLQAEQRFVSSLDHEQSLLGKLKGATSIPPPPPQPPTLPQQSSFTERERQPYSRSNPMSASVEDEDSEEKSIPERQRKPYSAKEGMGKTYDNGNNTVGSSSTGNRPYATDDRRVPPTGQHRADAPPPQSGTRPSRTNSAAAPRPTYSNTGNDGRSNPINIPPRHHSMSSGQGGPSFNPNGGYPSPSSHSFYGRGSEPFDNNGSMPSTQFGSSLHQTMSAGVGPRDSFFDTDEDSRRRYNSRPPPPRPPLSSGPYDDEPPNNGRGKPIPPRSTPVGNNYDYGSGPPIGSSIPFPQQTPVGSFPSRPAPPPFPADDRRRSMYAAPTSTPKPLNDTSRGPGGSDGWGSFAGANPDYRPPPPPPLHSQQSQSGWRPYASSTGQH